MNVLTDVPRTTLDWLLAEDNPAVAVLTRRTLLGEPDSAETQGRWQRRNEYAPVAAILEAANEDGSFAPPARDYSKYGGGLWQIHFLGELHADESDERLTRAIDYAFSRQLPDGSWSCNGRPVAAIPCLTANVGRAIARMGHARDDRVVAALAQIARLHTETGVLGCRELAPFYLNGYCHMLAPKVLLFLAEVPRDAWPEGAEELREAAVEALRDKHVFGYVPQGAQEFADYIWHVPKAERREAWQRYIAEHSPLEFREKPGWLKFGFPLSYNSDALEALAALAAVGEPHRPEYDLALSVVRDAADAQWRWKLRNSFNGKTLADVETKGEPSKWLTLRALQVLDHFAT